MTLDELENQFTSKTSEEAKEFLKTNMRKLAEKQLLGRFYKLYARTYLGKADKKPVEDFSMLNSPLLRGGERK